MKATKHQMMAGDYAVFHGDKSSARVQITFVDEAGYTYEYLPTALFPTRTPGASVKALDNDRLEACSSEDQMRILRRAWLERHPEALDSTRL